MRGAARSGVCFAALIALAACSAASGDATVATPRAPVASTTVAMAPNAKPTTAPTVDIYAADRPNALSPVVKHDPPRVYVPNSLSNTVDVIDPATGRIIDHYAVGMLPQHVVPSWDLKHLYVTNDRSNTLTPIDPRTGA